MINQKGIAMLEMVMICFVLAIITPMLTQFTMQFNAFSIAVQKKIDSQFEWLFVDSIMRQDLRQFDVDEKLTNNLNLVNHTGRVSYFVKQSRLVRQNGKRNRYITQHEDIRSMNTSKDCVNIVTEETTYHLCH